MKIILTLALSLFSISLYANDGGNNDQRSENQQQARLAPVGAAKKYTAEAEKEFIDASRPNKLTGLTEEQKQLIAKLAKTKAELYITSAVKSLITCNNNLAPQDDCINFDLQLQNDLADSIEDKTKQ